MLVVATLAMALGSCLLVLSPIFALLGWSGRRDLRRLERVPRRTCAELLGDLPRRCIVVGEVRAGPSGLQTAALSGAEVAWHRTRVWRRHQSWSMEDASDELVWEHASVGPFALQDATGGVLLSPALFDPDTAVVEGSERVPTEQVVDEYERSDRSVGRHGGPALQALRDRALLPPAALSQTDDRATRGYRVQELVVRADQPVSVLAAPVWREGRLLLDRPRRGRYFVSSRTVEELLAIRREDARSGFGYAGWFLLIGAVLLLVGWLLLAVVLPGEAVLG